jgi:gas vesicle protein
MPHHNQGEEDQGKPHGRGGAGKLVVVGVLGSVIGAATAMLLSPWRGAEARLKLKERAQDVSSKVGEKAKEMATKAKEMLPEKGED